MSNFLTINGTAIPIIPTQCRRPNTESVDRSRMFDGTMHAVGLGLGSTRKRQWIVTTAQLHASAADALSTLLTTNEQVTVAGDWIGGTVIAWGRIEKETPTTGTGEIMKTIQFTLIEP